MTAYPRAQPFGLQLVLSKALPADARRPVCPFWPALYVANLLLVRSGHGGVKSPLKCRASSRWRGRHLEESLIRRPEGMILLITLRPGDLKAFGDEFRSRYRSRRTQSAAGDDVIAVHRRILESNAHGSILALVVLTEERNRLVVWQARRGFPGGADPARLRCGPLWIAGVRRLKRNWESIPRARLGSIPRSEEKAGFDRVGPKG